MSTVELLLRAPDAQGGPLVLMQRRARPGGAGWGLPGGTRSGGESPAAGALRIAAEQTGVPPDQVRIRGEQVNHHGGGVVIADAAEPWPGQPGSASPDEGTELAWIAERQVTAQDLDPGFAAGWPALQVSETGLLVDGANVVGSRPDGWWRDRAGAAERLLRDIAAVGLPGVLPVPEGGFSWFTRPVVVLEGKANQAPNVAGVEVVRAPGSGDDAIVEVTRRAGAWLVVTADRGLRARLPSRARPVGPNTLRSWLTISR